MRKYIVILLLVAAVIICSVSASLSTYEPNLSLLMHMNSSVANPTFFNDSSTNNFKFTSSGNVGHNLSESAFGNATANFTAAGSGYLATTRTAALGLNGVKNYTVMLWFKRYGTADGVLMGAFGGAGAPAGFGIRMNYPSNGLFRIYTPAERSTTSAFTNDTGFHQLVVHINNSVVQVYIDGVAQTMDSSSAVTPSSTDTGGYAIGRQGDYSGTYYTGAIDEVAIWKNVTVPISDLYPQTAELYLTSLAPVASFTASNTTGTYPPALPVNFTDTSTNTPTSWQWNATNVTGNNTAFTFATTKLPTYSFGIGNFTISLNATNADGSGTSAQVTWINVSTPTTVPVANFTANGAYTTISGTVPFTVNFVYPQTNGSTSWSWIFGDGNTTSNTDQNPSHLYTAAGTYSVNHSATNVIGIGWKNVSSMIVVSNATGFTPQDIWMVGQFPQTFHITDKDTGLPIPVVQLQDTAMQTYTTTNGTGYLTEAFGASSVTFISTGYSSKAISYVFDSDENHSVQLTPTTPGGNKNTWYTPWQVRIRIVDYYGAPLPNTNVNASYIASTLPSTDINWLVGQFGIDATVASEMINSSTAMAGTTDDNGGLSFSMFKSLQYRLVIVNVTSGVSATKTLYPSDQEYVIYVRTAGQTANNNTLATRNATLPWYSVNSTHINLNMTYIDTSLCTSQLVFRVWFRDNNSEVHNTTWSGFGAAKVFDNHTVSKAPIGTEYLWGYNATTVC
jgi:PKD repeat protein